ncbi:MAG: protein kinase domain-containing protein [Nannocystales bacterium]
MVDARRLVSDPDVLPAPPIDKVGEDVAMARIQGALFGSSKPPTLERYALIEKLGEGSYGAVYSAWDPRLDRKVAIKVLHGGATEGLHSEARALAKLAHPNVVTVHDVGESGDELFLAMEFVDGKPLSTMDTTELGWRAVVAIYRQAAAGLAAAHDAGIVHRDFKPANALLGTDGRVRVLDFGLARAGAAQANAGERAEQTRSAGTPRYMAPEQHRADGVDARTDQYCFCVALWEAVYGQPPFPQDDLDALRQAKDLVPLPPAAAAVPTRISRVLQRGLAPLAADRFASMRELDTALARSLTRHTRTLGGVVVVTLGVSAGVAFGQSDRPCEGSKRLPGRWSETTRSAMSTAFEATALPHAASSGRTAQAILDRWATEWAESRYDACLDHERGLQSAQGLDLRTRCLDAQLARFDAQLDVFLEADPSAVDKAVRAVGALPSPQACADIETLRTAHPVPADARQNVENANEVLARGRAELEAGHHDRAAEAIVPVREACASSSLDHPPTCVAATLVAADAASWLGDHDEALAGFRTAAIESQRAQLPESFARAAAGLTWELGEIDAAFDHALTWAAMGHAAIEGRAAPALRSALLNNEGAVLASAGRWDEATAVHERSLADLEDGSPLRMRVLTNLANIDNQRGRIDEAERAYAQALEIGYASFGSTHPRVLLARQNRAGMRAKNGRADEALAELLDVLEAQRAVLGPEHPVLVSTLTNLAIAQRALDDAEGSLHSVREAKRIVRAVHGKNSWREIECMLAESDALLTLGQTQDGIQVSAAAVELSMSVFGKEHLTTAYTLRSWGHALQVDDQSELALEKLREAKSLFIRLGVPLEAGKTDVDLAAATQEAG